VRDGSSQLSFKYKPSAPAANAPALRRYAGPVRSELLNVKDFANSLCPPTQIDVQRWWYVLAFSLSLQTFQFLHGAIELAVNVSLVAEELVGCILGRHAEASGLCVQ
jgi:hypothetical protein